MVPNVSQQLAAIRQTIQKTLMPALDPDDAFAQEQAGLVLASLDWTMDVVTAERRYEEVEQAQYRDALAELLALDGAQDDEGAREALAAAASPSPELELLRAGNVDLKRQVQRQFHALTATPDGPSADPARRVVTRLALAQNKRESAWARMTGFPTNVDGSVGEVLAAQSAA